MKYSDFLDTVKVLKMLYGRNVAEKYFLDNIHLFDKIIDNASVSNLLKD